MYLPGQRFVQLKLEFVPDDRDEQAEIVEQFQILAAKLTAELQAKTGTAFRTVRNGLTL